MTPAERQALREKHYNMGNVIGRNGHNDSCAGCSDLYPCEVIKALDELDRIMSTAEVYAMLAQAMWDENRNLNSPIPATDPYAAQERTTYLHPSERRAMREAHQPHATFESQCNECSNSWPCDSSLLLDQLDAIAQGLSEWLYNIKLDPKVTIDLIIRILDGGL